MEAAAAPLRQARPPRGRQRWGWQWPVVVPVLPPPDEGRQERVDTAPHHRLQPGPGDNAAPARPRGVNQWQQPRRVRQRCCLAFVIVVAAFVWGRPGKSPSPTIVGLQQQFADVASCGSGEAVQQGGADPPPASWQDHGRRPWMLPINITLPVPSLLNATSMGPYLEGGG